MSYKKTTTLAIATMLLLGTFATAQTDPIEHSTNSVIAYFDADGTLLPTREGSEYYRYFNSIVSGCYLVQDFYSQNDQKQTDPICFTDPSELQSWFPVSMQGPLVFWDIEGNKAQEGYSEQDAGRSGLWREWDNLGRLNEYELINGELIISYFDIDGNRQPMPTPGGTFRTLIDYNPEQDVYIIADYFSDTRTKQMDPVVIQRDDLLRWGIEYRDGLYVYYNEEGDLITTEQYIDGKLDGIATNWYSGIYPPQKLEQFSFVNGQQEGLHVRWYSNGFPKVRMVIQQGNITEIQCWDEQFRALDAIKCPLFLQDTPEVIEYQTIEEEKPIEIILPDAEVKQSTVIFPHDKNGEQDKSNVIIIEKNIPATPLVPAVKIQED